MKVYYLASQSNKEALKESQLKIKRLLEQSGVVVVSSLNPTGDMASSLLERAEELGQSVLDQMDALVVEGSGNDPEIGYLLAYAVSSKKPTLYLMEKGSQTRNPLVFLTNKNIPKNIIVRSYGGTSLEKILYEMLQQIEKSDFVEAPTIKFTLRITPQIEQYLHWKTHNTKTSKADFLRQLIIDEVIKKDEDYRKYRGRKNKH
ncbi:hypothetical protein KKG41_00640 [Patescibacteria group bacterium]|nr:hypothetical protein [Patescibacteria group bacterium]